LVFEVVLVVLTVQLGEGELVVQALQDIILPIAGAGRYARLSAIASVLPLLVGSRRDRALPRLPLFVVGSFFWFRVLLLSGAMLEVTLGLLIWLVVLHF